MADTKINSTVVINEDNESYDIVLHGHNFFVCMAEAYSSEKWRALADACKDGTSDLIKSHYHEPCIYVANRNVTFELFSSREGSMKIVVAAQNCIDAFNHIAAQLERL